MKRKLKIMSAEDEIIEMSDEDIFDDEFKNISEDFDFISASLEKLVRDGDSKFALEVCGHINQAFSQIIEEIVESI